MKHKILLVWIPGFLLLLTIPFVLFHTTGSGEEVAPDSGLSLEERLKDASSDELGQCPFGHKQLKDVPILYGLLAWSPELKKQVDNLEVWPGGCFVGSEKIKVVCTQCRYTYSSFSGYWEKTGSKANDFQLKQATFIADWPYIDIQGAGGGVGFSQSVKDKKVFSDDARYWSSMLQKDIDAKVQQYLKRYEVNFTRSEESMLNRRYIYYRAKLNRHYYFVELMRDGSQKETFVSAFKSLEKPYGY